MTKSSEPTKTQLTTYKDGARQLKCNVGTFSIHIKNGELDVVKVGIRGRRVIQAQLEALIVKNTIRARHVDGVEKLPLVQRSGLGNGPPSQRDDCSKSPLDAEVQRPPLNCK